MTAIRVILITVAGPAGHVDVGVRSDAMPAELAASLGTVLGLSPPWPAAEHRSPPRPGDPRGQRSRLRPGDSLADAGVADGDLVLFRKTADGSRGPTPPDTTFADGAGLAGPDLADAGLAGADVADAGLAGADLAGADLARAQQAAVNGRPSEQQAGVRSTTP